MFLSSHRYCIFILHYVSYLCQVLSLCTSDSFYLLLPSSYENCPPPPPTENPLLPPPFVVRAILFYGRSLCMPIFKGDVVVSEQWLQWCALLGVKIYK